jgi:hypothetical protein
VSKLYCVTRPDGLATYADSVEAVKAIVTAGPTGGYKVEEIDVGRLAGHYRPRRWGVGIKRHDGTVIIEPARQKA